MLHIATSNGFMDWQKYPKRRKSIRILQPETLDSIKRHTFPVMGGRTLDFPLHYPALQFFFVPNVLIEMPAHTNSFIVLCNGLKSDFMACACTSPSRCPTVWLGTTELSYFRLGESTCPYCQVWADSDLPPLAQCPECSHIAASKRTAPQLALAGPCHSERSSAVPYR